MLDENGIEGTRFPPYIQEPWSILRRTYTGPKLVFLVLFSILAFLPLIGRAALLIAFGSLEQRAIAISITALERNADLIRKIKEPARAGADFLARAEVVTSKLRATAERGDLMTPNHLLLDVLNLLRLGRQILESAERAGSLGARAGELREAGEWTEQAEQFVRLLAPSGTVRVQRRPVWILLIGLERGLWSLTLSIVLLLYNGARALLTYSLGPLRDEEERSDTSPALSDYRLWWRLHQVSSPLLAVTIASGLYRMAMALTMPVLIPVVWQG